MEAFFNSYSIYSEQLMYRHWTDSPIGAGFRLAQQALVNLDSSGIVTDGSGYVTEWANLGAGGSAYDLNTVVGTLANSSVTTLNGIDSVATTGGYGLEPTTGQLISSASTVFVVGKFNSALGAAAQYLFGAKSNNAARNVILMHGSGLSNQWTLFQGDNLFLSETSNANPHVFTGQFNYGATSALTVSGIGSVTGNGGTESWDYCTLFADNSGSNNLSGYISQFIVFDRALSDSEILSVQSYLASKYAL